MKEKVYIRSKEWREKIGLSKIGNKNWLGKKHSEETKLKISLAQKGRKISDLQRQQISKFRTGRKASEEARRKMSLSHKGIHSGDKHPNWQGGITAKSILIRCSSEYAEWRKRVFERDGFRCVLCGITGVELNADHIKPFSLYPELRFDLGNGRTLCVPCHKQTDTYLSNVLRHKNTQGELCNTQRSY